jgi:hypothetical protein
MTHGVLDRFTDLRSCSIHFHCRLPGHVLRYSGGVWRVHAVSLVYKPALSERTTNGTDFEHMLGRHEDEVDEAVVEAVPRLVPRRRGHRIAGLIGDTALTCVGVAFVFVSTTISIIARRGRLTRTAAAVAT